MRARIPAAAAFAAILASATASARTPLRAPVPFTDAYRDGYVWVLWGQGYVEPKASVPDEAAARAMLRRIGEAGARHITLPVWGCQSDLRSADVGACTIGDAQYTYALARLARSEGFETSFLPIVLTPAWEWRGFFDPRDVDAWFASYQEWISGVAREAAAQGMKELVVASEMTKLYRHSAHWKRLLASLRSVFAGPLVMTVNWGDTEQEFWADADAIGISAYYPLSAAADPSQAELDAAWSRLRSELVGLSVRHGRPLHLTEVGYPTTTRAAATPWDPGPEPRFDSALQARCFEAFRRAWEREPALVRANVWATSDPLQHGNSLGFEVLGKPAEAILREFFGIRAGF